MGFSEQQNLLDLSVFNGFSALLWDSLLSVSPHVIVQKPHAQPMPPNKAQIEQMKALPSVRAAAPFIAAEGFALRRPPGGEMIQAGVAVRGIDAAQLEKITDLNAYLWAGDLDLNIQPFDPDHSHWARTRRPARRSSRHRNHVGIGTQRSLDGATTAVMALQSNGHFSHGPGRTGLRTGLCIA